MYQEPDLHLLRNEATAVYCGGSSLRGLLWNVGPFSNVALFNTGKIGISCVSCTKARSIQTKIMVSSEPDIFHQLARRFWNIYDMKKLSGYKIMQKDAALKDDFSWFNSIPYGWPFQFRGMKSSFFNLRMQKYFFSKSSKWISLF